MEDFEKIKQQWISSSTPALPNLEQIRRVIKEYQIKKKRNVFLVTALFILCGIAFILIVIFHNPSLWTTTIGEILISIGFLVGLILKLKTLRNITKAELKSNKDFLEDLVQSTSQKKSKLNWHLLISVLLLAIGYGFFIYEEIRDNQLELVLTYLGISLFTLGMYFVFKPFARRRSINKAKKILEEIEKL